MENKQLSNLEIGGYSATDIRDTAQEYLGDFQERFAGVDKRVRQVVNERPVACVLGAFAVGYLFAKTFRMWR